MAAKPKLTPEQWAEVRKTWENDSRDGFAWLVKELDLPVSRPAVRKVALTENWTKKKQKNAPEKTAKKDQKNKVSKVSQKTETKVSETIIETFKSDAEEIERGRGRPTKYRNEYAEQAYKLCLLGYTDKELADFFGVEEQTINNWKLDHKEFFESLSNGKVRADAVAAERLFVRVCGYKRTESKTKIGFDKNGKEFNIERTVTEKEVPPDVNAAFLWLKNRQASRWRDRVDNSIKLDGETLKGIADKFTEIMEKARERQKAVLIERGILIDNETGRPVDG
ncbi:hypothetical protein [Nitrosomonas marina]|uniref:Phage terminase small subunit n=1 Tax=Nitrosomonas marina TaxID=917 RepID=A0A1H8J5I4_9PROT|nr:hypothetical protein [Nitrosomonas marina]SEN75278.1 hypothetical protein SAMN05216325_1525 [Nitrosomonas marina]